MKRTPRGIYQPSSRMSTPSPLYFQHKHLPVLFELKTNLHQRSLDGKSEASTARPYCRSVGGGRGTLTIPSKNSSHSVTTASCSYRLGVYRQEDTVAEHTG